MTNTSNTADLYSRLAALSYGNEAGDFIRFHDDPLDESVRGIVQAVVAGGDSAQDAFRSSLDEDSTNTLRLYAMRATLQAKRRTSFNLIDDAMVGFALLPAIDDVPWDSWVKAALFVARSFGRDLLSVGDGFAAVASEDALARFNVAFESMSRVETLEQCRMSEVATTHGTGFVETLVFRDKSSYAFYSAPRTGDDIVVFRSTTNLAQLAVNVADALDGTGGVITGPIGQDQLAASLFSQQVSGSYLAATGCLSFVADATSDAGSFTVFVAELPDGTDTDELASGAELDGQYLAVNAQRLVLFVAQPSFDDDEATEFDVSQFAPIAQKALQDSASSGWHLR
jgi:hypothetical protein